MSLHITVLGTDGSGKSTITAVLPAVLAAEFGVVCGSAGERFLVCGPDEDHLAPNFHPDGLPVSVRFAKRLKRVAKRFVDNRQLYPAVKLAHMIAQDHATWRLTQAHHADLFVTDGNVMLSATGRAANYLRPASRGQDNSQTGAQVEDLRAVFHYVLSGRAIPGHNQQRLPDLRRARMLYCAARDLGLECGWLPDVVIFLDLSPRLALDRIARRGVKRDLHENEKDLAQAREMYLRTLEAFRLFRPESMVIRIDVDGRSPGQVLAEIVEALRERIVTLQRGQKTSQPPLGTTEQLSNRSVWRKVFNYRYLVRYMLRHWSNGAWREPLFVFSDSGRLFLREGYSAGVMRAIYDRDEKPCRFFERVFWEYPLHRAVYDRLQILTRHIEPELALRLSSREAMSIITAPSGFAYDLFRPLDVMRARDARVVERVRMIACDLDPHGTLEDELEARAAKLGIQFKFLRGDLTDAATRERLARHAPYQMALFVGLSSWLPKPKVVEHLRWLTDHLSPDGILVTDSFTPAPYALSGRYVSYKAHYYPPDVYKAVLDYCGFDGLEAVLESGRDGLNHVMLFKKHANHLPKGIRLPAHQAVADGD